MIGSMRNPLSKLVGCALFGVLAIVWTQDAQAQVPDDGWIVFASNRNDGRHEIYLMQADGSNVSRLTNTGARMPTWSPDGRWIAYETVPVGYARVMRWDLSEDKQIFTGQPLFWMWDNSGVVCRDGDDFYLVDPDAETSSLMFRKSDFSQMDGKVINPGGITTNGRFLVTHTDRYRNGYSGTNGSFNAYHAAVILDFNNPDECYFFGSGCEPHTPPAGNWVYHVCGGDECAYHPDLMRMDIGDRQSRSSYQTVVGHADADWGHEYFPRISTDGNWMVYGATTGCHDHDTCQYEIFVHPLGGGNDARTRVSDNNANDQWPHLYVGPLWSGNLPRIDLAPSSLSFSAVVGDPDPASQDVVVSNGGAGTLDNVGHSISYDSGQGWLSVSRSGSGNSQTLTNSVSLAGLSSGNFSATVQVDAGNAGNSPSYSVALSLTETPELTTIQITPASASIQPGGNVTFSATALDQTGAPFSVVLSWSVSAGGTVAPATTSAGGHSVLFSSNGSEGSFQVVAEAGPVQGTAGVQVSTVQADHIRINCGSNSFDVPDWDRDDDFVSGGQDWDNPDADLIDVSQTQNAAPVDVYKSVRHSSPHSYSIPVPDGTYTLRLHFCDKYADRSMNYVAEGQTILTDFDITTEAGGQNIGLTKEFEVQVGGGDGLQLECTSDGDVFESGIEVIPVVIDPEPDGGAEDGGVDAGGDAGVDAGADAGGDELHTDGDGGVEPQADEDPEMIGGCDCSVGQSRPLGIAWLGLLVLGLAVRRTRRDNSSEEQT